MKRNIIGHLSSSRVVFTALLALFVAFTGLSGCSKDAAINDPNNLGGGTVTTTIVGKIIDEAAHRWPLLGWAVSHRVGTLKPGEVAVAVAVSTKHRKESFEACQFIIDQLKEKVPVFKKEVFEDGEEWVGARPTVATHLN